jgi:SPW repeat
MMVNSRETGMMRPWTRWQNWVNVLAGIALFISPWYTVTWGYSVSSWNAWIVGGLIFLVALWALAAPDSPVPEIVNIVLGVWAVISTWVLGYVYLTGEAWSAWIIGIVVAVLALWAIADTRSTSSKVPA